LYTDSVHFLPEIRMEIIKHNYLRFSKDIKDFVFVNALSEMIVQEYLEFLLRSRDDKIGLDKRLKNLFNPACGHSIHNELKNRKFQQKLQEKMKELFLERCQDFDDSNEDIGNMNEINMAQLSKDYMRRNFKTEGLNDMKIEEIKALVKQNIGNLDEEIKALVKQNIGNLEFE